MVDFKPRPFCWVGPTACLDVLEKNLLPPPRFETPDRLVHSLVGYATPARDNRISLQREVDGSDNLKVVYIFGIKYTTPYVHNQYFNLSAPELFF